MVTHISPEKIGAWDPLDTNNSDQGMIIAAQRRVIRNILKSYTGYYDLFSEMLQNALDAVERRKTEKETKYEPKVWVKIDMQEASVSVTDNGCGMSLAQFKQFLSPNLSFKDGAFTRGNKGVGATYLAYGFNYLEIGTKQNNSMWSGVLRNGRVWLEDRSEIVLRPMVEPFDPTHNAFLQIDRGATFTVKLIGDNIRPKNLSWMGATSAKQWLSILKVTSPLGGIYLSDEHSPEISIEIEVIDPNGISTIEKTDKPEYLFPHEIIDKTVDLRDFLNWQAKRVEKGLDASAIPPKFKKLNGIWGAWTGQEILSPKGSPIITRLDSKEEKLAHELGLKLYIFLAFSTDLWDSVNDRQLNLRQGQRILHGGLQLATKNMPQGNTLTIPMTNNIGFQNLAHVIIHLENAEPDLGRKGFQPEIVSLAEKISVSAVTAFRGRYNLLKKPGGAKIFGDDVKIDEWIKSQESHEISNPLRISGLGLFKPTYELPIRSEPMVEQDVVALFNQMLSSGIIRGIQLISSSQYKQYDGLYRISMVEPFDDYIYSNENPLGVDKGLIAGKDKLETPTKILEYKYSLNGLIEEFQSEVKSPEHVTLAIAWEIGEKWKEMFDVVSYLDEDNVHHRQIHGTTHSFTHSMTGQHAFEVIILQDLIQYLRDPKNVSALQHSKYSDN